MTTETTLNGVKKPEPLRIGTRRCQLNDEYVVDVTDVPGLHIAVLGRKLFPGLYLLQGDGLRLDPGTKITIEVSDGSKVKVHRID